MIRRILIAGAVLVAAGAPQAKAAPTIGVRCGANEDRVWVYESLVDFNVQAKLKCGEQVEVVDRVKGYVKIRLATGDEGFVAATAFPKSAIPPEPEDKSHDLEAVSEKALASAKARGNTSVDAPTVAANAATAAPKPAPAPTPVTRPTVVAAAKPAPVQPAPAPKPAPVVAVAVPAPVVAPAPTRVTPPAPQPTVAAVSAPAPAPVAPKPVAVTAPAARPAPPTVSVKAAPAPVSAPAPKPVVAAVTPEPQPGQVTIVDVTPTPAATAAPAATMSAPAPTPVVARVAPKVDPDSDEEVSSPMADPSAGCNTFFVAYGLSPNQFKWIEQNRKKAFPTVCPAPTPAMVDYIVIFTHDVDFYSVTMPTAVHHEQNGFSDWAPLSTVDTALMSASDANKAHHEYVWVFHSRRGAYDPSAFSAHRKPLFSKDETNMLGSHGGFHTVMDALTWVETNGGAHETSIAAK